MATAFKPADQMGQKLVHAFARLNNDWRTLFGLARDTGYEKAEIADYIRRHGQIFVLSSTTLAGEPAYRLSDKPSAGVETTYR